MIKNQAQLIRSQDRKDEVKHTIEEMRKEHHGDDVGIFIAPFLDEIKELESEINEYLDLTSQSLEESVDGRLSKLTLLDGIGELLAKMRIAAGYTQTEMAERLGWQQSNLSRFEHENYSSQTIAKIVEYATELDVWLYVTPRLDEVEEDSEVLNVNLGNMMNLGVDAAERAAVEVSSINDIDQIFQDISHNLFEYESYPIKDLPKRSTTVPERTKSTHFRESREGELNWSFIGTASKT